MVINGILKKCRIYIYMCVCISRYIDLIYIYIYSISNVWPNHGLQDVTGDKDLKNSAHGTAAGI